MTFSSTREGVAEFLHEKQATSDVHNPPVSFQLSRADNPDVLFNPRNRVTAQVDKWRLHWIPNELGKSVYSMALPKFPAEIHQLARELHHFVSTQIPSPKAVTLAQGSWV